MTQKWNFASAVGALHVCLALSSSIFAQVAGGTLSGTVIDPSGGAVQGAQVTILNPATGVTRNLVTNDSGVYSAPNLVPSAF